MIVFDDMIADMLSNKKPNSILIELFIRERKLNIYFVFITQSYFSITKNTIINSSHYFNAKQKRDSSRFRKNLLERILKLIMEIDHKIRDEKLQYDIIIGVAKISVFSSGKIDKYEFLTDEEIFLSHQSRII